MNQTLADSCARLCEKNTWMNELVQSTEAVMEEKNRIAAECERLK